MPSCCAVVLVIAEAIRVRVTHAAIAAQIERYLMTITPALEQSSASDAVTV